MEDPPSNSPLVCSAFQGLVDHPIGLSTAPALAQFVHCALTLLAYIHTLIRVHREHWRLNRYFLQCTGVWIYLYTQGKYYGTHHRAMRKHGKRKITVWPPDTCAVMFFHVHVMTWWHYIGWFLNASGDASTN